MSLAFFADDPVEVVYFSNDDEKKTTEEGKTKTKKLGEGEEQKVVRIGAQQPPLEDDETDSSEDEAVLNTVGDIPLEWYEDEEHMGYDLEGRKLLKSERSALDKLLAATDDPDRFRTIIDALHDEKKVLSNEDLEIIFNLQRNRTPNPDFDLYADYPETYLSFDPLNHPLARSTGPSKRKYIPAPHELKIIDKLADKIIAAKAKGIDIFKHYQPKGEDDEKDITPYLLWDDSKPTELEGHAKFRYYNSIPKPNAMPPGTYESYRPPPEYLPSDRAKERFQKLRNIDRKEHFLPQQFQSLRHVPFYHHTLQDRYQRCLDLCAFPRMQRTRLVVDPKKLLPELPDPQDLRPYPERLSFSYKGHTAVVRSVSCSPNGQYLATGCDDHLVRIFEVMTGRLLKRYDVGGPVQQVLFCPSKSLNILAVAVDYALLFLVPSFCSSAVIADHSIRYLQAPGFSSTTAAQGGEAEDPHRPGGLSSTAGHSITQTTLDRDETAYEGGRDLHDEEEKQKRAEFMDASSSERQAGIVVKILMHARVKQFSFHNRGDYLCALCPKDHVKYRQTIMLQLSKRKVFCPFRKFAEIVTGCCFHPSEPFFYLSTSNIIRRYNLLAHKLDKKFKAQGGITTSIDVHPDGGDHFIVGDTTNHTSWYDVDFGEKPYKRMRSHKNIVNAVRFHTNCEAYPLFASGSSDGQVHIFHGMVFDDYNKNAQIVPVKILKHQRPVYDIVWHPSLPWIFTASEDGSVLCWTEV